mmetsp:Transcript_13783/g.26293  ORF Transcript_13783/g.26293 Transcript_13783/m.26293 type:complete len:184 (-) Transcript_13783:37-588(-)
MLREGLRFIQFFAAAVTVSGVDCVDETLNLPKYCCNGITPNPDYTNTYQCNPQWTHEEYICKGVVQQRPCHACMVHLPETNRWLKTFSKKELYDNCASCVQKCMTDADADEMCKAHMADIKSAHFGTKAPEEVLCTGEYLKSQLDKPNYPVPLKRTFYKSPKLTADDEYHQPSDWNVAGVGAK